MQDDDEKNDYEGEGEPYLLLKGVRVGAIRRKQVRTGWLGGLRPVADEPKWELTLAFTGVANRPFSMVVDVSTADVEQMQWEPGDFLEIYVYKKL